MIKSHIETNSFFADISIAILIFIEKFYFKINLIFTTFSEEHFFGNINDDPV